MEFRTFLHIRASYGCNLQASAVNLHVVLRLRDIENIFYDSRRLEFSYPPQLQCTVVEGVWNNLVSSEVIE